MQSNFGQIQVTNKHPGIGTGLQTALPQRVPKFGALLMDSEAMET